ncbi:hypothetical protein [Streptomyces sp. TRM68367]|uniref:hypothetical protein n=1 Tax=Streptomyces sp. TRM68367 TaxID=2758415 RepID=UPI0021D1300E|nr:hypothetical protein [Streptomyces sp. TRM68367]
MSVALLAALAGGAGGEAGRQAWAGLSSLVRRPFRRQDDNSDTPAVSSGEAERARLTESPGDTARAQALSTALAVRAALDAEFHAGLQRWRDMAEPLDTGNVQNVITGGSKGPVIQGRDFSGININTPPPGAASPGSHRTEQ